MYAARNGHSVVVRLLAERGAKIDFYCGDGFTALTLAGAAKHWEVVKILAKHNADFEIRDATGRNSLDYLRSWRCRSKRQRAEIEAILARRVRPFSPDLFGRFFPPSPDPAA